MEFRRLDLTTEVKRKNRKRFLIAGVIKTKLFGKGFKKVYAVEQPIRVLPDIATDTSVKVRRNGAPFATWTPGDPSMKYGVVLPAGKYSMEVKVG